MSALSITASAVIPPVGVLTASGTAGETVAPGQFGYYKPSDQRWWKADATTPEKAGSGTNSFIKMFLSGASAGQPVVLLEPNQDVTVNAVLTPTVPMCLSATSGSMGPHSDLVSGNQFTMLGYAKTTSVFRFEPRSTGIVVP